MNQVNRRATTGVLTVVLLSIGAACSSGDDAASTTSAGVEPATTPVEDTAAPTTSAEPAPTTTEPAPTTQPAPTTEAPAPTTVPATTAAPASTAPATTAATTEEPPPTTAAGVSYPTLPDGTPVPVLGIYNDANIALSGFVHSEAAREKLEVLAVANSKNPEATVSNEVMIDPTVPPSIGIRVLELNSVRFPAGTAEITAEHGLELDRAISIMEVLPNATVLVIGHADPRGDEEANFKLSNERAQAVANHLVEGGISPLRVSARAAGELDLLTLADDEAALALNRRTEFVFYGLLLD